MTTLEWAKKKRHKAHQDLERSRGNEQAYHQKLDVWKHWNDIIEALLEKDIHESNRI